MIDTPSESKVRLYNQLIQSLGTDICGFLEDEDVREIMLNSDESVWVDRKSVGLVCESSLKIDQALSIIHAISGIKDLVVTRRFPILEVQFPFFSVMKGERFTAQIPPIVAAPSFNIRKHSPRVFSLQDYVSSGRMTEIQADFLKQCIRDHLNILVVGAPFEGKSTLLNCLIYEAEQHCPLERFLILEDTPELQCTAKNSVRMLTSADVDMRILVKTGMRMRPDRILIGEVRDGAVLDMLKAWNTGCPGGICTIHANGAKEAIQRVLDLAMETGIGAPPISLVKHTIQVIVSVGSHGTEKGYIHEILQVGEDKNGEFTFKECA